MFAHKTHLMHIQYNVNLTNEYNCNDFAGKSMQIISVVRGELDNKRVTQFILLWLDIILYLQCTRYTLYSKGNEILADLGGACPAQAPQGSRFFRFNIQNFQNVTALGVGAPTRLTPPAGNPGSATVRNVKISVTSFFSECWMYVVLPWRHRDLTETSLG